MVLSMVLKRKGKLLKMVSSINLDKVLEVESE